jgi:hypothetical protein
MNGIFYAAVLLLLSAATSASEFADQAPQRLSEYIRVNTVNHQCGE